MKTLILSEEDANLLRAVMKDHHDRIMVAITKIGDRNPAALAILNEGISEAKVIIERLKPDEEIV